MGLACDQTKVRMGLRREFAGLNLNITHRQLLNGLWTFDVRVRTVAGTLRFVDHVVRPDETSDEVVTKLANKIRAKLSR